MKESLLAVKDYLPVIVAVISAILAFILGKASEKNKKFITLVEESINLILADMYKEVIEVTSIKRYNVRKIKKFLIKYSDMQNNHKMYDNELFKTIIILTKKFKLNQITNIELQKEFEKLSFRIEKLYWERTKAILKGYDWWVAKKVKIRWLTVPVDIIFKLKDILEYPCIVLVMSTVVCIADKLANQGSGLTSQDVRGLIYALTLLAVVFYGTFLILANVFNQLIHDQNNQKLVNKL